MSECSFVVATRFKNSINEWLKRKNITDITKYDIVLNSPTEYEFTRWEYDINKPMYTDLTVPTQTLGMPTQVPRPPAPTRKQNINFDNLSSL